MLVEIARHKVASLGNGPDAGRSTLQTFDYAFYNVTGTGV